MNWVLYSLIAACGFGTMTLVITHLAKSDLGTLTINMVYWLVTGLLFLLINLLTNGRKLKIPTSSLKWFALLSVLAFIANYCSVRAFQAGPNTGVVRSVQMAQIAIAAIGAYLLFHQALSVRNVAGMVLVVAGILLVVNK